MDRDEIDRLLRELYAARLNRNLEAVCRSFSTDARLQIAGAIETGPVGIKAAGIEEFRPLLALLIKTFKLDDLKILKLQIEDDQATVHWRANIRSRITGATVPTDMIDLVEVRDGRIVTFNEVFVPR